MTMIQDASAPVPRTWEGDRMLHIYMWDYCQKRNFHQAAQAFIAEAGVAPDQQVPIDAPQGLLYEWWTVFWEIFTARSLEPDAASVFKSDAHAYVHGQEAQRGRMLQEQQMQQRNAAMQRSNSSQAPQQPSWSAGRAPQAGPSVQRPAPPQRQHSLPYPPQQQQQQTPQHTPQSQQQHLPQQHQQQLQTSSVMMSGPVGTSPGRMQRGQNENGRSGTSPNGVQQQQQPSGMPSTPGSRPGSRLGHGPEGDQMARMQQQQHNQPPPPPQFLPSHQQQPNGQPGPSSQPHQQSHDQGIQRQGDAGPGQGTQGPNHELSAMLGLQRPASSLLIQQCMHMMGLGGRRVGSLSGDEKNALAMRVRRIQTAQNEAQMRMAQLHGHQAPGRVNGMEQETGIGLKRKSSPDENVPRGPPGLNRPNDPAAQMQDLGEQQQMARRQQQQSVMQQQQQQQHAQQQQQGVGSSPMQQQTSAMAFNSATNHAQSQISQQIHNLQQAQQGKEDGASNVAQIQQLRRLQGRVTHQQGNEGAPQVAMGPPPSPGGHLQSWSNSSLVHQFGQQLPRNPPPLGNRSLNVPGSSIPPSPSGNEASFFDASSRPFGDLDFDFNTFLTGGVDAFGGPLHSSLSGVNGG